MPSILDMYIIEFFLVTYRYTNLSGPSHRKPKAIKLQRIREGEDCYFLHIKYKLLNLLYRVVHFLENHFRCQI